MNAFRQFDLHGKRAVVTGGGTGMGYNMALALARSGAQVMIGSRREDVLRAAVDRMATEELTGKPLHHVVDLADFGLTGAQVRTAFAAYYDHFAGSSLLG